MFIGSVSIGPRGEKGEEGEKGDQGKPGITVQTVETTESEYVWLKICSCFRLVIVYDFLITSTLTLPLTTERAPVASLPGPPGPPGPPGEPGAQGLLGKPCGSFSMHFNVFLDG